MFFPCKASLKIAVNGVSEGTGINVAIRDRFEEDRVVILDVGATDWKGISLRTGIGDLQHPSTDELRVHGYVQSHGVEVHRVPRSENLQMF